MNPEKSNKFDTQLTDPAFAPPAYNFVRAGKASAGRHLLTYLPTLLFYFSILAFIIGFNFTDVMVGNWYQQFMPNLNGRSVTDVFFLDSLTGWAVTNATNQNPDTTYVLKTTNSGDNWVIQYRKVQTGGGFPGYNRVYFLNQNTGFVCGVTGIDKTTNGGTSWLSLNAPPNSYQDMSVLNENTIWLACAESLLGGVFFTSNGGASWQQQLTLGPQNPNHIYMFNAMLGFICRDNTYLRRTTDGGGNWTVVPGASGFLDMYFSDSLTGWKTSFQKTTDGGLNWVNQVLPQGGDIILSQINQFSNIGTDTIWAVGGYVFWPGFGNRGMIYRTTNSGTNWLFQVPDTNINIGRYLFTSFINKLTGWAYTSIPTGVHTTNGGDPIFYVPVRQISNETPKDFKLYQNYPNPFNPLTKFSIEVSKTANAKVIVYDITGKAIEVLVEARLDAGEYEITFNGKDLSSGAYFYSLIVNGSLIDTKKMLLVK